MTPCEERGYKVGDKFRALPDSLFPIGTVVTLERDDGTECPLFAGEGTVWNNCKDRTPGAFDDLNCFIKI